MASAAQPTEKTESASNPATNPASNPASPSAASAPGQAPDNQGAEPNTSDHGSAIEPDEQGRTDADSAFGDGS
ncbi:MAG: hypothetical protein M1823_001385 [Watsoniomyces obsoletus]|nr:MAG: hypothetical protein M1823_001385 [Watsoniomyces obsoletus]